VVIYEDLFPRKKCCNTGQERISGIGTGILTKIIEGFSDLVKPSSV